MAKTLEERLQRLEDTQAIRNVFSSHAYTNVTGDEYERNFSHTKPDIGYELERLGVYEGQETMQKRSQPPASPAPPQPNGLPANAGRMSTHYQCTFVIEIAGDGRTAQATCLSPGHVTGAGTVLGKFAPMWSFCRYGIDFVREADGKWKIWHERVNTVFNSLYFVKGWVQRSIDRALQPAGAMAMDLIPKNANRNTTIDAPYGLNWPPRLVPPPPVPYETFSATQAYIPPPAPQDL